MPRKRTKKISILIVPEDKAEPYSFRIDAKWVKYLVVLTVFLVAHMIVGGVFYWKYAKQYKYNRQLLQKNAKLETEAKKVFQLAQQFNELEENYRKVRSLLGIESDVEPITGGRERADATALRLENIVPVNNAIKENVLHPTVQVNRERFFITQKKSKIHKYSENLPTLLPVEGFLTADFQPDNLFLSRSHNGIDIAAKKGSIVKAAGSGVIIFANWTFDLGNLIIIDHGNGILSYYGHNQRLLKSEKTYVRKGEPIALLGSSGRSSGPHLHFEIWKDGVPVDPKEYLLAFQDNSEK